MNCQKLSEEAFVQGLQYFEDNGWRPLSGRIKALWYEFLAPQLNDKQFAAAIKFAVLNCDFRPTAVKLLEFASMGLEVRAAQEWQSILDAVSRARNPMVSDRALFALSAIGGVENIGMADKHMVVQLESKFCKLYLQSYAISHTSIAPQSTNQIMGAIER
ncbi:MAG: hypothetical protein F6K65_23400 [Moorea sp. SIO3C2]|nr:hypothetical protein [Moorena sp. SIO3C2]